MDVGKWVRGLFGDETAKLFEGTCSDTYVASEQKAHIHTCRKSD